MILKIKINNESTMVYEVISYEKVDMEECKGFVIYTADEEQNELYNNEWIPTGDSKYSESYIEAWIMTNDLTVLENIKYVEVE